MIPQWCATAMGDAALAGERTREEEQAILRETGGVLLADPAGFASAFFARLFARQPELRLLFPADHAAQAYTIAASLGALLAALDRPLELERAVQDLGRRHRGYGARFADYLAVGEALIETLAERNGARFDAAARLAWARLVSWIVYRMRHAATDPRREAPPLRSTQRTPPPGITAEIG